MSERPAIGKSDGLAGSATGVRPPRHPHDALERARNWRTKRADALRVMPWISAAIFLFPLLLQSNRAPSGDGWSTATIGLFIFIGWAVLIALVGWLSHLGGAAAEDEQTDRYETRRTPPSNEAATGSGERSR